MGRIEGQPRYSLIEFSVTEIVQKLQSLGYQIDEINKIIAHLENEELTNDEMVVLTNIFLKALRSQYYSICAKFILDLSNRKITAEVDLESRI